MDNNSIPPSDPPTMSSVGSTATSSTDSLADVMAEPKKSVLDPAPNVEPAVPEPMAPLMPAPMGQSMPEVKEPDLESADPEPVSMETPRTPENPSNAMTTNPASSKSGFNAFIAILLVIVVLIWAGVGYIYYTNTQLDSSSSTDQTQLSNL